MTEKNIFKGVKSIKFNQRFKDDNACLEYLAQIKWLNCYKCKRCNNDKFGTGKNIQKSVIHLIKLGFSVRLTPTA